MEFSFSLSLSPYLKQKIFHFYNTFVYACSFGRGAAVVPGQFQPQFTSINACRIYLYIYIPLQESQLSNYFWYHLDYFNSLSLVLATLCTIKHFIPALHSLSHSLCSIISFVILYTSYLIYYFSR